MPELRKDPISGRWVIISVERGKRPSDFWYAGPRRKKAGFVHFVKGTNIQPPLKSWHSGPMVEDPIPLTGH